MTAPITKAPPPSAAKKTMLGENAPVPLAALLSPEPSTGRSVGDNVGKGLSAGEYQ